MHTPGPWVAQHLTFVRPLEEGYQSVGFIYGPSFAENSELGRTALADCQLAASAPELLAALQDLNALVWGECPSLLNEDSGGNSRLAMKVEEAIAKATGEQS